MHGEYVRVWGIIGHALDGSGSDLGDGSAGPREGINFGIEVRMECLDMVCNWNESSGVKWTSVSERGHFRMDWH